MEKSGIEAPPREIISIKSKWDMRHSQQNKYEMMIIIVFNNMNILTEREVYPQQIQCIVSLIRL